MTSGDWQWKLSEASDRIRTRYSHIGSKTGAPFLAIAYPPAAQSAVLKEWHVLTQALQPEFDIRSIDLLEVTQRALEDVGVANVAETLKQPMPGSDPLSELHELWATVIVELVHQTFEEAKTSTGRPVVSLERCAALHPVMGPSEMMRALWGRGSERPPGPVIVLIPGTVVAPRKYEFLGTRSEFMYRGDLL